MHLSRQRPRRPTGWRRRVLRLPIHLFRAGLGPLFGGRLLLLIHTGRQTGLSREAVLEVVALDRRRGTWTIASGFGPEAQWYRNLRRTPQATIQFGRTYHVVTAEFPTVEEGGRIMAAYARRHRRAARALSRSMGFLADGGDVDFRTVGEQIPFVRLRADEPI
ncbi:nitroreductase family deazaflavin-dependent oxidoreductase [Streptomyces sp. NPDC004779]